MAIGIDPTAAPPFMGPTPPDAQEMTLGEHLQGALQALESQPVWDAQTMKELQAFMVGLEALGRQRQGQGQSGTTPGQNPMMSNETGDYEGGPESPSQEGQAEYGSV